MLKSCLISRFKCNIYREPSFLFRSDYYLENGKNVSLKGGAGRRFVPFYYTSKWKIVKQMLLSFFNFRVAEWPSVLKKAFHSVYCACLS